MLLSFIVSHGTIVHFYQSIAGLSRTVSLEHICCVIKLALNCQQKRLKLGEPKQKLLRGRHVRILLEES